MATLVNIAIKIYFIIANCNLVQSQTYQVARNKHNVTKIQWNPFARLE